MTRTRFEGRRRFVAMLPAAFALPRLGIAADAPMATRGRVLRFPFDEGSHPSFRIEWWYVTGWLLDASKRDIGFQITFFRSRTADLVGAGGTDGTNDTAGAERNPSRFAPTQLIVAHAALADPRRGKLLHTQRAGRAAFGLAGAGERSTDVHIGSWSLRAVGEDRLRAVAIERELRIELDLQRTQPPLLQGDGGYSRKGPSTASASHYYTLPHLAVSGTVAMGAAAQPVTGVAWLDHEWSSTYMEASATGWDWIGINLDDGGALMAFRMRDASGATLWSGATRRDRAGATVSFDPQQLRWTVVRSWQSPRSRATYPIAWRIDIGSMSIEIVPLFDDQEQDARASTGTIYWEGAVRALEGGRTIGRGYLELTGYWRAFRI